MAPVVAGTDAAAGTTLVTVDDPLPPEAAALVDAVLAPEAAAADDGVVPGVVATRVPPDVGKTAAAPRLAVGGLGTEAPPTAGLVEARLVGAVAIEDIAVGAPDTLLALM